MECAPGASDEVVRIATPPELRTAVPMVAPLSVKMTLPVAVPPLLATVAVRASGVS